MRLSQKKFLTIFSMILITVLFITLPRVSSAKAGNNPVLPGNKTIIVKDGKSGAVIYQNNRRYYYGFTVAKSQAIIGQGEIKPDEIIVKYRNPEGRITAEGMRAGFESLSEIAGKLKANVRRFKGNSGLAIIQLSRTQDYFRSLQELAKNPNVQYAEPNYKASITQVPNDTYYRQQWGPRDIQAELAWDKVSTSQRAKVIIAVLDTGINLNHEDLGNSIIPGYNFVEHNSNPVDYNGHGTHVAGIAAAITNNGKGIAGISGGSLIMPVKVIDDSGSANYSDIIDGIRYATDHGATIINMSLGGSGASRALQDAVNYAINHGVTVVAAAGNNNGPVGFPGNYPGVITVGAVDRNNQRAPFSSYGPEMDVMAPGVGIFSSYQGNPAGYTSMNGTSMATPFVSGVAALVKAVNPNLSQEAIARIINQSAGDLESPGFDNNSGYGLVNAEKAVSSAMRSQTGAPAPQPSAKPGPAKRTNLALHKPAFASSVEGSSRTAANAVDGNPNTRWASQPKLDSQYIYIDLGKSVNISQIALKWEAAYAKAYRIYVSDDGRNWNDLYYTSNGSGGTNTINLTGQGRYVLLYCLQRATDYGYSLWEFEVYGS